MNLKTVDFHASEAHLDELLKLHNKNKNEKCENAKKFDELERDNKELFKRLFALIQNKEKLKEENLSLQKKLFSIKLREKPKNIAGYFHSLCELLGYSLPHINWDKVHKILYLECYYNENCLVRFLISRAGLMDCIEIVPQHPDFKSIQEHFRNTQDASTLLALLRKYFSAIELKDKL